MKLSLTPISSRYASVAALNANFDAIEDAIENTLSRNNASPNTMLGNFDMNGNRIINIADPVDSTDAVSKGWLESLPVSAAADAATASAAAVTATAAAAVIDGFEWTGQWYTATSYAKNNLAYEAGNTYICLATHTSGTFGTDFGAGKWELFSAKGAAGAGTGDMLGSNNLSDLTNMATARATLGVQPTNSPTFTGTVSIPTPVAGSDTTVAVTSEWVRDLFATFSTSPTGSVQDYLGSTAPSGWILLDGGTIGSGSSGATTRANADTSDLYTLIWNSMANTEAPVSTGRGASAAADFAANKTITLPDARGRVIAGKDNMGGTTASRLTAAGSGITGTTLGAAGGAQNVTLTSNEMPLHTHGAGTLAITLDAIGSSTATNAAAGATNVTSSYTGLITGATASAGSGNAHNNTQPTLVLNKIVKL